MSDLFVAELLIFALLVPPLLRPFFSALQRLSGIAALPLVALILALATLFGDRFRLSFAPALVFTLLVFLYTLPRLIKLVTGFPSDWFGAGTKAFYALLIGLFGFSLWLSARFAPELAWAPASALVESRSVADLGYGRLARLYRLESAERGAVGTVLLIGTAAIGDRSTAAQGLAEAGYRVTEARFSGRSGFQGLSLPFSPSQAVDLIGRIARARSGDGSAASGAAPANGAATPTDVLTLARKLREESGSSLPLFVLAEGSGVPVALEALARDQGLFAGVACLLPPDSPAAFAGAATLRGASGFMSGGAERASALLFYGEGKSLYGFGEVGADDPLAAFLSGGERDAGRKLAELTARRLLAWFEARRETDAGMRSANDDE